MDERIRIDESAATFEGFKDETAIGSTYGSRTVHVRFTHGCVSSEGWRVQWEPEGWPAVTIARCPVLKHIDIEVDAD